MIDPSLALPSERYPAFAPLPVPIIDHLIWQEYQRTRRMVAVRRPEAKHVWDIVEANVRRARKFVFEYMDPFVRADYKKHNPGQRVFPDAKWLISTLATYTPNERPISPPTLDHWQQRGLLRRDRPRGPFELTSVATILIARSAEKEHQRHWLPSELTSDEPRWWAYSQLEPEGPVKPVPIPLPDDLSPGTMVWTPWLGARWKSPEWGILHRGRNYAYRQARRLTNIRELKTWDNELGTLLENNQRHPFFRRELIHKVLLAEAGQYILEHVAQRLEG